MNTEQSDEFIWLPAVWPGPQQGYMNQKTTGEIYRPAAELLYDYVVEVDKQTNKATDRQADKQTQTQTKKQEAETKNTNKQTSLLLIQFAMWRPHMV